MERFEKINASLSFAREHKPQETDKFWDVLLFFEREEREFGKVLELLKVGDILLNVDGTSCIFLQKEPGLCFLGYSKERKLFTENASQIQRVLCRKGEMLDIVQRMDFLLEAL
ncbi:hypothetical protein A9K97_gp138 [Tokyovirus A1]|uniref:hypothetical protein n=1 Tax=Tokyovirus A1 TaxID=1826170 RepID=UPI0007A95FE1|nr:hypothetical protein A9K97_gp138 [Tokyovirus A1]BAU80213.1 hypothetical protein [Tokyovirus A1]